VPFLKKVISDILFIRYEVPNIKTPRKEGTLLKDEIKRVALMEGASNVGIASVDSFAGAPKGHTPADFIPDAKSVISFGIRLLDATVERDRLFLYSQMIPEELRRSVQEYIYNTVAYSMANTRLGQTELLGLRWRDLDSDIGLSISVNRVLYKRKGVFEFKAPRTSHSRCYMSMTPKPAAFLREYRQERKVFIS